MYACCPSFPVQSWKKRFCILYRSGAELYLQYYENYEAALTSLPKDVVALQGCLGISKDLDHRSHKHLFSIQLPHRTYYFSASSEYVTHLPVLSVGSLLESVAYKVFSLFVGDHVVLGIKVVFVTMVTQWCEVVPLGQ